MAAAFYIQDDQVFRVYIFYFVPAFERDAERNLPGFDLHGNPLYFAAIPGGVADLHFLGLGRHSSYGERRGKEHAEYFVHSADFFCKGMPAGFGREPGRLTFENVNV